jgi:hypothetical protein
MADPKLLYAVTAFVFAGLSVWLLVVLRTAKESWALPLVDLPKPAGTGATDHDAGFEGRDEDEESGVKRAPASVSKLKQSVKVEASVKLEVGGEVDAAKEVVKPTSED